MMNTAKWSKRSAALVAAATVALAVMGPTAEAGTANVSFTVNAQVFAACTATTGGSLAFPNYTSGQAAADSAEMDISIQCAGATNAVPDVVHLAFTTVAPVGAFSMTGSAHGASLVYSLCDDAACTGSNALSATGGSSGAFSVGQTPATPYKLWGSIAGGLTPTVDTYSQTVNGVVTY
jgi:spore coat protein U-like protein